MDVILLKRVPNLGFPGDLVQGLKAGYVRNYLIPQGFAQAVNPENKKFYAHQKMLAEKAKERHLVEAKKIFEKVNNLTLSIVKKTAGADSSKIYGKVTSQEVVGAFQKEGFDFSRKQVRLREEISSLGVFEAELKIHSDVTALFKIWVVSETEKKKDKE